MSSGSLHQISDLGSRGLGLRRLGLVLRERAWLILLCVLLGGAAATAYAWRAPKNYAATAVVKYQAEQLGLLPVERTAVVRPLEEQIAALKRMLSSTSLLREVAENQKLASLPEFNQGSSGNLGIEEAIVSLQNRLSIRAPDNDVVIFVTVRDSSASRSADLANAVVDALVDAKTRDRERVLKEVSSQLESVLSRARDELKTESASIRTEVQPAPNTPDPTLVAAGLQALSEKIAGAELQLLRAEASLAAATAQGTNLDALLRLPAIARAPALAPKLERFRQLEAAFAETQQRYKEKHFRFLEAQDQLAGARAELTLEAQLGLQQLEAARAQARDERDRLHRDYAAQLESARAQAQTASPTISPATGTNSYALRQLDATHQFHDRVMQRINELRLTSDLFVTPLRVDQRAVAPLHPSGPDPYRITAYGLLGGLLAGILICLVFGLGDTSLKTVDEIESILGIPVLSVVPTLKDNDTEMAAAEGFRSLRTSIAVSSKGKEPRIILFTSTSPDEGKTFCALNFSVGLAQQGHKTVLIECDLRRPMAAPSLAMVKVDAPGVSDFLKASPPAASPSEQRRESGLSFAEIRRKKSEAADEATDRPTLQTPESTLVVGLEDVVQRTEVANLFFVAAGKPVANPTELLARPRFEQLLNSLLQRYDRIVLDSAPILGVSETLFLSSKVQGICFVVRGGHTPRNALIRAVEILRRADAPLLGAVLNGINPKRSDPYGQDYYYHRTAGKS